MKLKTKIIISATVVVVGAGFFLFKIYHTPKTFDDMVLIHTLMHEAANETESDFSSSILSENYSRPVSLSNISLENKALNAPAPGQPFITTIVISGTAEFTNNASDTEKGRPHFVFGAYQNEQNGEFASYSFQYGGGQNRLGVHSFFDNLHLFAQVPNDAIQEYDEYLKHLSENLTQVKSDPSEFYSNYVNGRHEFTLNYPKPWSMLERNLEIRGKTILCFSLSNSTNECDVRANITKDIDEAQRLERIREKYKGHYLQSTTTQVAGLTGTDFEIGGYGVTRIVIFKNENSLYEFTAMQGKEALLIPVLNTLKFN